MLTWEQKLAAIQELCGITEVCLRMRGPGDWYVSARGRTVGGDPDMGNTSFNKFGNGRTPEEAVHDDWRQLVEQLASHRYVRIQIGALVRRVRWNGNRWADVRPPERV